MIFHANIQPPDRGGSGKRFSFSKAPGAVFCTGQSGCESAQSISRSSFRRPHHTAGYPRCERSPDRLYWYAASSRVALLTSSPPPPSLLPSSCDGSGAYTRHASPHRADILVCALSTSSIRRNGLPCLLIDPSRRRLLELCSLGIRPR